MPAAVLECDLADETPTAAAGTGGSPALDRYSSAFVVIRFRGTPVGHCWLPVENGHIDDKALQVHGLESSFPALSRRWLEHQLGWRARSASAPLPSVTVAICTRERPHDLDRALGAVMRAAGSRHPVIVVDNRPATDATQRVVHAHPDARYVREDTPGLNAARNRAMREATTEIVAFCDDDAVPEPGWLEALREGFDHPLVMGVTGLTLPLEIETPAQEWFERSSPFGRGYFRRVFDPLACTLHSAGQVGAGANMAVRRAVIELVGPFDERLDAGTPTQSGGDHEMFARILESGHRLVYEPRAVSWHRHRRTWEELRETLAGYGTGVYAAWTGRLLERGDVSVLKQAGWWFVRQQLPALFGALTRRPGAAPLDLVIAELGGCARGPAAWGRSARLHRARVSP